MFTRVLSIAVSACLISSSLFAADSSMVGTWKLNPKKSKFSGLVEKIENLGGDKYKFSFGDDVETIAFDGKDQKTKYGDTWAVTKTGPNSWKEVDKRDGKVTATAAWTLSKDGNTFTSTRDGTRPDGSTFHNVFKAKRTAGSSGLAGTWESSELKLGSPAELVIASYEGDGLSLVTPAEKEHINLKFDGKDYADKGPRVAKGSTVSGKRIDAQTVEIAGKLKGKIVYSQRMKLSEDGKTLTATVTFPGVAKPEIDVYERQ